MELGGLEGLRNRLNELVMPSAPSTSLSTLIATIEKHRDLVRIPEPARPVAAKPLMGNLDVLTWRVTVTT